MYCSDTCAALMAAWNPEPHNLLTVSDVASSGHPAPKPAWRARYAASDELYFKEKIVSNYLSVLKRSTKFYIDKKIIFF